MTIKELKNFLSSYNEDKEIMVYNCKEGWVPFDTNENSEHNGKIYLGLPEEK